MLFGFYIICGVGVKLTIMTEVGEVMLAKQGNSCLIFFFHFF